MKDEEKMFPQLKDGNRRIDLALLVVILEHLNDLNVILQGKDLLHMSCIKRYRLSEQYRSGSSQYKLRKLNLHKILLNKQHMWVLVQPVSTVTLLGKYRKSFFLSISR
jgi:hypothetical protein